MSIRGRATLIRTRPLKGRNEEPMLSGTGRCSRSSTAIGPALCTDTRVAPITGRYQYRLPIGLVEPLRWSDRHAPEMGVPPGFPTLPSLLRGAGYRTALIGKWHLGYLPRYSPLKSGYDEFFGVMGGFTGYTRISATAVSRISTRARSQSSGRALSRIY